MSDAIDEAARRVAISLMRLNEALETAEADHTVPAIVRHKRRKLLWFYYRDWFRRQAREME